MFGRRKRLLLIGLGLVAVAGMSGCEQPDDVVSPISRTQITLTPQLLPTTPPGMVYELFVAPDFNPETFNGAVTGAVSVERFRFDNSLNRFLDTAGNVRADANRFILSDDFLNFGKVFIAVDSINDPEAAPGPIMLIDDATDPLEDVVKLVLPLTATDDGDKALWDRTVSFNMETPSDSLPDNMDGYGVWFSRYQLAQATLQDTNALNGFTLDSIYLEEVITEESDPNPDDVIDSIVVDSFFVRDTTFGLETFSTNAVDFTVYRQPAILIDDTLDPNNGLFLVTRASIDWALGPIDTITFENFFLVDTEWFAYPGWSYKGWVVSPKITDLSIGEPVGTFTEPAWELTRGGYDFLPGRSGGLVTTGPFPTIQSGIDNANPWVVGGDSGRIPKLPGEDFIDLPGGTPLEIVPTSSGELGSVFITLEPDNFVNRNTNFPLLIFTRRMPVAGGSSSDSLRLPEQQIGRTERFDMINWARTNDPQAGAPSILVSIVRQ